MNTDALVEKYPELAPIIIEYGTDIRSKLQRKLFLNYANNYIFHAVAPHNYSDGKCKMNKKMIEMYCKKVMENQQRNYATFTLQANPGKLYEILKKVLTIFAPYHPSLVFLIIKSANSVKYYDIPRYRIFIKESGEYELRFRSMGDMLSEFKKSEYALSTVIITMFDKDDAGNNLDKEHTKKLLIQQSIEVRTDI